MKMIVSALAGFLALGAIQASQQGPNHSERNHYTGDAPCLSCHQAQGLSYLHTAHHLTSRIAGKNSVLGPFEDGKNVLMIQAPAHADAQPGLFFRMEEKNGSYYESAVTGWGNDLQTRTERIDIVIGSGVRGLTYLCWQGDSLFELPVSYWKDGNRWINSPGYEDGTANFSRPVNPGCLECHATYIRPLSSDPLTNAYERDSFVPGIACETCHGPGAEHVARQKAGQTRKPDETILNPARFTRERQIDLCALCHNGIQREEIAPAFSYMPGQPLSHYFKLLPDTAEHPDVHGNQVGLLERSHCFRSSQTMTCSTCHDVHGPEKPAAAYSERCLGCHQWQSCGRAKVLGAKIKSDCVDCHMPVEATNVIVSETAGREVRARMRNHWIKVYPNAHLPKAMN